MLPLLALMSCGDAPPPQTTASVVPVAQAAREAAPPAAAPAPQPGDDEVVASWKGGEVTRGELRAEVGPQLIKLESEYLTNRYDTESTAVQSLATQRMLQAEVQRQGLADLGALMEKEIDAKTPLPSDEEIAALYPQVARQLGNRPLDEVKDIIGAELYSQARRERFMAYVDELAAGSELKVLLPYPEIPRMLVSADDDPVRGDPNSPVTMIQFAEFQ